MTLDNTELSLAVQYVLADDRLPTRNRLRRWLQRALTAAGTEAAEVTLRFVDADEGQALNRDYRGKDYATNVLTFVYEIPAPGLPLSGDIVICVPVVAREAEDQGKDFIAHCAHLVVHGALHLAGYDHEGDDEAEEMEALERQVLAGLRFPDPYAGER